MIATNRALVGYNELDRVYHYTRFPRQFVEEPCL